MKKRSANNMLPLLSFPQVTTSSVEADLVPSMPRALPPIEAPSFPSFCELVEQDRQQAERPSRPMGLFQGLLGGNAKVLFHDMMKDPTRYDPEVQNLVQEVMTGMRPVSSLTPEESETLDKATLDFTQAPSKRPKQEDLVSFTPREVNLDVLDGVIDDDEELTEIEEELEAIGEDEGLEDFWWRQ